MLTTQFQKIQMMIQKGLLGEALSLLLETKPETAAEHRMKSHLQAKILFSQGAHKEGIRVLEDTVRTYGTHLTVLSDLALGFYNTGDFKGFTRMIKALENEFARTHNRLSDNTLVSIVESMRHLNKALEHWA